MSKIKCVIAAGGLGTRLQGFRHNEKTKILLEVNGVPMINRQIYQINQWGIEDFIIITSPDFDELIRKVTSSEFPNLNINYSCLLYTSPSPRDVEESRMPSSA